MGSRTTEYFRINAVSHFYESKALYVSAPLKCYVSVAGSVQGPHEKRVLGKLLSDYNVLERPVANESEPIVISFGISLQQIIDVVSSTLLRLPHPVLKTSAIFWARRHFARSCSRLANLPLTR